MQEGFLVVCVCVFAVSGLGVAGILWFLHLAVVSDFVPAYKQN